jgi:hypothetical protein
LRRYGCIDDERTICHIICSIFQNSESIIARALLQKEFRRVEFSSRRRVKCIHWKLQKSERFPTYHKLSHTFVAWILLKIRNVVKFALEESNTLWLCWTVALWAFEVDSFSVTGTLCAGLAASARKDVSGTISALSPCAELILCAVPVFKASLIQPDSVTRSLQKHDFPSQNREYSAAMSTAHMHIIGCQQRKKIGGIGGDQAFVTDVRLTLFAARSTGSGTPARPRRSARVF